MQQNSVSQSARGRWLAGAVSSGASAAPASSAVAAAPTVASTPVAPPAPVTTPTTAVNPGGTNAGTTPCAQLAARNTYLYVTQAQPSTGGALTLIASPAKLICGGPDDSHYNVAKNIVTAHLLSNASIEVFPTSTGQLREVPIKAGQLNGYLKTDGDTKIFLVGGPVSSITSLQEQFHP